MVSGKIFIQILPSDSKKACGNLALRPLAPKLAAKVAPKLWKLAKRNKGKREKAGS
jgi:hypothetical protein